MTTDTGGGYPAISEAQLGRWKTIATTIAQAVVAELPQRIASEPSLSPPLQLAHSLFSELRFALGSSDTINGNAQQLLPFQVTEVDIASKGKIKYKRQALVDLGAKVLTITYRSGDPQVHTIPAAGEEIAIALDRPGAVAVTLWNGIGPKGAPISPILVSFVTYQ